jgi:hypothetical protein
MSVQELAMSLSDDIVHFLQKHPDKAYCDDCLAKNLEEPFSKVEKAASALGSEGKIDRRLTKCVKPHATPRNVNSHKV